MFHFFLTWKSIYTGFALHLPYFLPSTNSDYNGAPPDLYDLVHFNCIPVSQWQETGFWFAEWQSYQLNILSSLTGPHPYSQGETTLLPMYPMVSQHKILLATNSLCSFQEFATSYPPACCTWVLYFGRVYAYLFKILATVCGRNITPKAQNTSDQETSHWCDSQEQLTA